MKIGTHKSSYLVGNFSKTTASEYCEFQTVTVVLLLTSILFPTLPYSWFVKNSITLGKYFNNLKASFCNKWFIYPANFVDCTW